MKIQSWKELNNEAIKIVKSNKELKGKLIVEGNKLIAKINVKENLNIFDIKKDIEFIRGKFLFNNEDFTLLTCVIRSISSDGIVEIIVGRIILGIGLKVGDNKNIKIGEAKYHNLNYITFIDPFKIEKMKYSIDISNYKISTPKYDVLIEFNSIIHKKIKSLNIEQENFVEFKYKNKINVTQFLKDEYVFRNFLMLLMQVHITVDKQYICVSKKKYQIVDCFDELNETNFDDNYFYRSIKIDNITNIESIYNSFLQNYDKLYPALNILYYNKRDKFSNLIRFISNITMLEYYSRTFDNEQAIKLNNDFIREKMKATKNKKMKTLKSGDDPSFKFMVKSLIINVNNYFKFSDEVIDALSEKIRNIRIYYVHYKKQTKAVSEDKLFYYSNFINDIVCLNIYKMLGLDITNVKNISKYNYYYDLKELI